jgi:dinuclear metal center YbgI/SA1388 family protein
MKIKDITNVLEALAPLNLQESYDNAGLIVGDPNTEVTGILFSLDAIESVVDEAMSKGCNMVVSHHPIVFRGLKQFNGKNYVERTVMSAIRNGVALYAIHTNLDNVLYRGVNGKIADKLGVLAPQILAPKPGMEHIGAGVIGTLATPMEEMAFLAHVKNTMHVGCIRHTALRNNTVQKIAICGGSGSFLLPEAIKAGADVFVTADFKYHEFFDAEGRIIIADIGHYESEQFTIELLFEIISEKYPNFALHLTHQNTNPVNYI